MDSGKAKIDPGIAAFGPSHFPERVPERSDALDSVDHFNSVALDGERQLAEFSSPVTWLSLLGQRDHKRTHNFKVERLELWSL
jgi:hypothetical protein